MDLSGVFTVSVALGFVSAAPQDPSTGLADTIACRPVLSLDGTWNFATDPRDVGDGEGWYLPGKQFPPMPLPGYAPHATGTIRVPGCWDYQGYGVETEKMRHSYVGKGWYARNVVVPEPWSKQHVFLVIGGVHRSAKAWIDGHYLGDHVGYLSSFEFEITDHIRPGKTHTITIQVDSQQKWDRDALAGCADLIDFMHIAWGGIWGHVYLEARGNAYLRNVFIQPQISPPACKATAFVAGDSDAVDGVQIEIIDAEQVTVARTTLPAHKALNERGFLEISCMLPGARLWSPEHPYLYRAVLRLRNGGEIVDTRHVRFGMREIAISGPHLLLNGKKLFLRGYGDDHIYPGHTPLPVDRTLHRRRLRCIASYGFNHVRHHSTIMPPEYYDACDEIGILVSAEFPIAYHSYYARAKGEALTTYTNEWTAALLRHRNHPCILDWCMGNELWHGVPLATEFHHIARELDPTRPFVDSDGLWPRYARGAADRPTLDLYFTLFGRGEQDFPLDDPGKYALTRPQKPVISHETGNFLTFPRLDQIELFKHTVKPFWLVPVREKLKRHNLLHEAELWAKNSEHLYLLCHKINTEALRTNPFVSGYHWWLFQDYWTTSNGIVDAYFRPKGILPADILPFNNDLVLLQKGLALAYRSGDSATFKILVSNYSLNALATATMRVDVTIGGRAICAQHSRDTSLSQGCLREVASLSVALPHVDVPARVSIHAELSTPDRTVRNHWTTWILPVEATSYRLAAPLFVDDGYRKDLARFHPYPIHHAQSYEHKAVYVTQGLAPPLCDALEGGACLILLNNRWLLPTAPVRFKTAWWYGSKRDNNVGTVVYDNSPAHALAPEGWCEAVWYPLLEGAHGYLLDALDGDVQVLVRGIEVLHLARNKALLFQARVGKGTLIVSGLNHKRAAGTPQGDWLLSELVRYGATFPQPSAALDPSFVRQKTVSLPEPPYLSGFARIKEKGEVSRWHTYRENNVSTYVCRQTRPGTEVSWETAPLPENWPVDRVTFVFAGGLGWVSEAKTEGFEFLLNGREALRFDISMEPRTWTNAAGTVSVAFLPKRLLPLDAVGFFYVTIARDLLASGRPCTLSVRSLGSGSKRWFAVHPYTNILPNSR